MKVTSVVITLSKNYKNGLLAYASIQLDDSFRVSSIRVIDNNGKKIIAMPYRQCADNVYRDVAYPVRQLLRDEINKKVLEAYLEAISPDAARENVGSTQ